jgi:thiol-disulfide isomerase/thioredoxin
MRFPIALQHLQLSLFNRMIRYSLAVLCCLLLLMPLGAQARGFTFTDTAGKKLTLSDFRGKWVLINFWATWCPPCLKEIPDLVSLYESRKDVMIIGIAMDYRDPKTVLKYVKSMSISYPVVLGDKKIAAQIGPVSMLPTTYVFDPEGKPAVYKVGLVSREDLEEFMRENSKGSPNQLPGNTRQQRNR